MEQKIVPGTIWYMTHSPLRVMTISTFPALPHLGLQYVFDARLETYVSDYK